MSEPSLLCDRDGAVFRLSLNRPPTRNALDSELVENLGTQLENACADPEVRVIVLRGEDGSFCSGVDLRSAAADLSNPKRLEERLAGFHRLIRLITGARQPVIAEVDGAAVGFGADLAFACDLRVASSRAYFQEKFVALGLMPDGGGTFHLPRLIGLGRALELLLLGARVDADRALELGLVNRVVPPGDVTGETRALAAQLASAPPLALAAIKTAVRASLAGSLDDALARERASQLSLLATEDVREGVAAFLERRTPSFRGR
jgi:enoyl-CoA hydratase/carnithine racemase